MSDAITADCRTDYHAVRVSGTRPLSDIWWVVLHDTEGGTALSNARYFAGPVRPNGEPGGSAHLCVDDAACYRCLLNEDIPWGAASAFGANQHGFHIEQCGYARWSAVIWTSHWKTLQRAAFKTAYHCHKFSIPTTFIDAAGLVAGKHGITTHAEVSKASKQLDPKNWADYTHSDPGALWPRKTFMALVHRYYAQLGGV